MMSGKADNLQSWQQAARAAFTAAPVADTTGVFASMPGATGLGCAGVLRTVPRRVVAWSTITMLIVLVWAVLADSLTLV